jgi:hypothetical protein
VGDARDRGRIAPKRRHAQAKDVEAVEEILEELAVGDVLVQVLVGRDDDAGADEALRAAGPQGRDDAALEDAEGPTAGSSQCRPRR